MQLPGGPIQSFCATATAADQSSAGMRTFPLRFCLHSPKRALASSMVMIAVFRRGMVAPSPGHRRQSDLNSYPRLTSCSLAGNSLFSGLEPDQVLSRKLVPRVRPSGRSRTPVSRSAAHRCQESAPRRGCRVGDHEDNGTSNTGRLRALQHHGPDRHAGGGPDGRRVPVEGTRERYVTKLVTKTGKDTMTENAKSFKINGAARGT